MFNYIAIKAVFRFGGKPTLPNPKSGRRQVSLLVSTLELPISNLYCLLLIHMILFIYKKSIINKFCLDGLSQII